MTDINKTCNHLRTSSNIYPDKMSQQREKNCFLLIFAPCIPMYVQFTHKQKHFYSFKEHIKIYMKIYINIAPTCFGLRPSSDSLHCTCLKLC